MMAAPVQEIIQDPKQIFTIDPDELRDGLKSADTKTLELFIAAMETKELWEGSSEERRRSLMLKIFSVTPPKIFIDKALSKKIWDLARSAPPASEREIVQIFQQNKETLIAVGREEMCEQRKREEMCEQRKVDDIPDGVVFLGLVSGCHRGGGDEIFKELMKEEMPLDEKVNGKTLFEMGVEGRSNEQFTAILEYYRKRVEPAVFRKLLVDHATNIFCRKSAETFLKYCQYVELDPTPTIREQNWVAILSRTKDYEAVELLLPHLAQDQQKRLYEIFAYLLIITHLEKNQHKKLQSLIKLLRKLGINPADFLPKRHKNRLTYPENFFMMLNERESCKKIVALTGNNYRKRVGISKTDRLYRTYNPEFISGQLQLRREMILDDMDSKEVWQDDKFLSRVDTFMQIAFLDTIFLFRDAWEKSGHDPMKMGMLLCDQVIQPSYIFRFFKCSFIDMYYLARGSVIRGADLMLHFPKLTTADEAAFFDPEKKQYHWRQMFNACCTLFDYYNLSLPDGRYYNWTQVDLHPQIKDGETKRLGFPDTRPT